MIRALTLAVALIALSGGAVAALGVGERIGPVLMNPGAIICDTVDDAVTAVEILDGAQAILPISCGRLTRPTPAFMEVVAHKTTAKDSYAILKIQFLAPATLGVQFGWVLDNGSPQGISI